MRKYSFTYFLGQSFKGLWHNGVMTFASIAVLTSCLVVMGSFVLLLFNVNANLESLGVLNHIAVFVDTGRESEEQQTAEPEPEEAAAPSFDAVGTDELMTGIEAELDALDDFIDLSDASARIETVKYQLRELYTRTLVDEYDARLHKAHDLYVPLYKRITTLASIEKKIGELESVEEIIFTSKTAALEEQKVKYSDYSRLFDYIKEGDNSLPDQFTVVYGDTSLAATLEYRLEHIDPCVYKVNSRTDIAQTLDNIRSGIIFVFVWFLVILLVVSLFVIVNTIRVAVYARKEEISIMRYIGATKAFITLPFLIEGFLIGLIASGLAFAAVTYAYRYIVTAVMADFSFIALIDFSSLRLMTALAFAAVGIVTGVAGSFVSLQKYLKA